MLDKFSAPISVRLNPRKQENEHEDQDDEDLGPQGDGEREGGGIGSYNHTRPALRVKAGLKAGSMISVKNHSFRLLSVG